MLYECLTLVNPFVHENVLFALQAIQATDPPPPSTYAPDLRPLDAVVAKALAKNANDRYADAADLRDDLTRVRMSMPNPERLGPYLLRIEHRASGRSRGGQGHRLHRACAEGQGQAREDPAQVGDVSARQHSAAELQASARGLAGDRRPAAGA